MVESSRRGFLKGASVTAAALAVSKALPALADAATASGPVQVWSTFGDRRHAPGPALNWKPASELASDAIVLNPAATRQGVLGFGAAFTDASCWMLSQLPDGQRAELMHELFAPDQMAFNVCRTCTGSSDYSRSVYSFDESDEPDPDLKKFSIDHDKAYILPILKEARKLNPELFLFSSPWSPPGWMKFNNSMLGGTIRKTALEPYSRYISSRAWRSMRSRFRTRPTPRWTAAIRHACGRRRTRFYLCAGIWARCCVSREARQRSGSSITTSICGDAPLVS
jgi:glucosylceramidase